VPPTPTLPFGLKVNTAGPGCTNWPPTRLKTNVDSYESTLVFPRKTNVGSKPMLTHMSQHWFSREKPMLAHPSSPQTLVYWFIGFPRENQCWLTGVGLFLESLTCRRPDPTDPPT